MNDPAASGRGIETIIIKYFTSLPELLSNVPEVMNVSIVLDATCQKARRMMPIGP